MALALFDTATRRADLSKQLAAIAFPWGDVRLPYRMLSKQFVLCHFFHVFHLIVCCSQGEPIWIRRNKNIVRH